MADAYTSGRPKLRKRLIIVIAAVAVLFALLVGFNALQHVMVGKFMQTMAGQAQTVSTMTARFQDWQPHLDAVGNVRAARGTDLAFEVAGLVESVDVKSGAAVQQGQLLMKLVDAQDRATLASLRATARLAALNAGRSRQQLAVQAISRAQYDADMAAFESAQAQAEAQAALVAKKYLRAPFAGRVGIITANPGQYINLGTSVVTLQQLDPVYVDFTVPQADVSRLRMGGKVEVSADAFPGKTFAGEISATDPKVDLATRNVSVEATVPNPDRQLVPGMFARVAVDSGATQRYLTLPQTAIAYAPYGDTVFVVRAGEPPAAGGAGDPAPASASAGKPDPNRHYVQQVVVTVGPMRGDQVAVLSGIKEGDVVVTSGQMKLKNGTSVDVNNKVQPAFDPNPHPVEQ